MFPVAVTLLTAPALPAIPLEHGFFSPATQATLSAAVIGLIVAGALWLKETLVTRRLQATLANLIIQASIGEQQRAETVRASAEQTAQIAKVVTLAEETHGIVNSQRTAMEQALKDQRTAFERQLAEMRAELHVAQLLASRQGAVVETAETLRAIVAPLVAPAVSPVPPVPPGDVPTVAAPVLVVAPSPPPHPER